MPLSTKLGLAAAGLQAGKGIFDLFASIKKNREADEIYKNTSRPIYNRPTEVDEVYNLAESEINNTNQAEMMARQAQIGLSQGIDALLKSGGKADFSSIYGNYGQVLDAAASKVILDRSKTIASYQNAAYNLGKAKDAEFMYNQDAPYKDAMKRAAQLKEQAAKDQAAFFTNLSGGAASAALALTKPGNYGDEGTGEQSSFGRNPSTFNPLVNEAQGQPQGIIPRSVNQWENTWDDNWGVNNFYNPQP